jgi:hypothetical protein
VPANDGKHLPGDRESEWVIVEQLGEAESAEEARERSRTRLAQG